MKDTGRLTLLHLESSTSQPVLWLLEELGIDYDIRKFSRPGGGITPEDKTKLEETHPQGASPQLIKPDGSVLTQQSAIILYLIRTYDGQHRFHRPEDDPVREEQLVCIGVSDLSTKISTKSMFAAVAVKSPFFIRPVARYMGNMVSRLTVDPAIKAIMSFLNGELKGREWFMGGDEPSRADFVLKFWVDLAAHPKYVDIEQYQELKEWRERCEARDGWKRSLEKGNGYDLDFASKW